MKNFKQVFLILTVSISMLSHAQSWKGLGDGHYIDTKSITERGEITYVELKHPNGFTYSFEVDCKLRTARSTQTNDLIPAGKNIYIDKALDYTCSSKLLRMLK
jgi:hypothetical protein